MATYSFINNPRRNQQIVRGDQPNKYVKKGGDSMDGSLTDLDTIQFDTTYTPTGTEPVGSTYWDDANHTISTVLENGAILQHGFELYTYGTDEGNNFPEGSAVSVKGATGNRVAFELTDISDDESAINYIGLLTTPVDSGNRIATREGAVRNIKTNYTGTGVWGTTWADGDQIWVSSTPGVLTNVKPTSGRIIRVGTVTNVHATQGIIELDRFIETDLSGYVPYTGATTDVDLDTYNLRAKAIQISDSYDFYFKVSPNNDLIINNNSSEPSGLAGYNIVMGYEAGISSGASSTIMIGESAGKNSSSGFNSVLIGYNAGESSNLGNFLAIGYNTGQFATGYDSVFIGSGTGYNAQNVAGSLFVGNNIGTNVGLSQSNIFIGNNTGQNTSASYCIFFGDETGSDATNANQCLFIGSSAGRYSTDPISCIAIGDSAGQYIHYAQSCTMVGTSAGSGATNASACNMFGSNAGQNAVDASASNFFGISAGQDATYVSNSNFFGSGSGAYASYASYSNFFGYDAGSSASNASSSNFFGNSAGSLATNASSSNFFGEYAGRQATNATNSIFIGSSAGDFDTVDNTSGGWSIAIGPYAGTGGYSNSIALGSGVINSATQQVNIGNVLFLDGIYNSSTQSATPLTDGVLSVGGIIQLPDYSTFTGTPVEGMVGYDFTNHYPVYYDGSNWVQI